MLVALPGRPLLPQDEEEAEGGHGREDQAAEGVGAGAVVAAREEQYEEKDEGDRQAGPDSGAAPLRGPGGAVRLPVGGRGGVHRGSGLLQRPREEEIRR